MTLSGHGKTQKTSLAYASSSFSGMILERKRLEKTVFAETKTMKKSPKSEDSNKVRDLGRLPRIGGVCVRRRMLCDEGRRLVVREGRQRRRGRRGG
jgi:hypothetical protein